jgi:hypothetical protein
MTKLGEPENDDAGAKEPIVVATYSDAFAAHAARAKLESEGVEAELWDENTAMVNPLWTGAIGGVKVVVPKGKLEVARAILTEKELVEEERCPKCGSTNLKRFKAARRASFLTILFLGIPFGRSRDTVRCEDCGNEWRG